MKSSTSLNNKIAIDTNVVIYALENQDIIKSEMALELLKKRPFVSNQVISESIYVLNSKRFSRSTDFCISNILELLKLCHLIINTEDTYYSAKFLMKKYKFGLYDSIIVANAFLANCSVLYSEDMYEVLVENKMSIINPFRNKYLMKL